MQALGDDCDPGACGNSNSPEIDHLGVHDFDSSFTYLSASGFRLVSFMKDHVAYKPVVYQATLTGRDLRTHAIVLHDGGSGATSLVGSRFLVVHEDLGTEYLIQIDAVDSVRYWARPDSAERTTPTYLVTWTVSQNGEPQGTWNNICKSPPPDDTDTLGMNRFHVVLFEGDRIDAYAKRADSVEMNWFNIGCAGHALSKQHLDGHTEGAMNAAPNVFTTSLDERTAHLKMLAGDYCGGGAPMTVAGQPLNWADDRHWVQYATSDPGPVLEARWDKDGAVCLNTPRVLANHTEAGDQAFPDIVASIKAACRAVGRSEPRPCQGPDDEFFDAHLLSANPVPQRGP